MTDQKQAPERDSVKWWIEDRAPVDVAEAFEALIKQRDELAAEVTGLKAELDIGKLFHDLAVKERDLERIRVDRLTAERDQALAASAAREIAMRDRAVDETTYPHKRLWRITDQFRPLLQAYGRVWEKQAGIVPEGGGSPMEAMEEELDAVELPIIKAIAAIDEALPLSSDGQQALDEMLEKAWGAGWAAGFAEYEPENPYRTQPSRSSDAGKSEDRG